MKGDVMRQCFFQVVLGGFLSLAFGLMYADSCSTTNCLQPSGAPCTQPLCVYNDLSTPLTITQFYVQGSDYALPQSLLGVSIPAHQSLQYGISAGTDTVSVSMNLSSAPGIYPAILTWSMSYDNGWWANLTAGLNGVAQTTPQYFGQTKQINGQTYVNGANSGHVVLHIQPIATQTAKAKVKA